MQALQEQFEVSEHRACRVLVQPRSTLRYETQPRDDESALTKRMLQLAKERPRSGYRRIGWLIRQEG